MQARRELRNPTLHCWRRTPVRVIFSASVHAVSGTVATGGHCAVGITFLHTVCNILHFIVRPTGGRCDTFIRLSAVGSVRHSFLRIMHFASTTPFCVYFISLTRPHSGWFYVHFEG